MRKSIINNNQVETVFHYKNKPNPFHNNNNNNLNNHNKL
jgi:hypothetical protein